MQSTKNSNYRIIHAQKILFGKSNKFTAGYLVINGQTIEQFIPETAGIDELTEEQKSCIVEIPNNQYVLPGIIDTNVSLHNESYDKDWVDNKYLSLLAVKYGITTIINQSLLKTQQYENNKPNNFNPQGNDTNIRISYRESNLQYENTKERELGSIKLISECEKLEQNQFNTQQKHSQILNDEKEKNCNEDNEIIGQNQEKQQQQIPNNIKEQKLKDNSLVDIFSQDKQRQDCECVIEPSTNSRTQYSELENQNKIEYQDQSKQDSHFELFCDFQSINIPESKDIYEIQKNKQYTNNGKSPSIFKSNNQQDCDPNISPKMIPKVNYSSNKFKLYTSPPVDPNVPFFTKPEQIAGFIKVILDQQDFNNDWNVNDSFESTHLDENECDIGQDNQNQLGFQNNNKNKKISKFEDFKNKKEMNSEETLIKDLINKSSNQKSTIFQNLSKRIKNNENLDNINSQDSELSCQEELDFQDKIVRKEQFLNEELYCNKKKEICELEQDHNQENTNYQKESILDKQTEYNQEISIIQSEKYKNQNQIGSNFNNEIFTQKTEKYQNLDNEITGFNITKSNLQINSEFHQNQSMNIAFSKENNQNYDQLELIKQKINETQQFTDSKKKDIFFINSQSEKGNNSDNKDNSEKESNSDFSQSNLKNIESHTKEIQNQHQELNKSLEQKLGQDNEKEEYLKQKKQDSLNTNEIEFNNDQENEKVSQNEDEEDNEQCNNTGLICDFIIKDDEQDEVDNINNRQQMSEDINQNDIIQNQRYSKQQNKQSNNGPIFFIHPSSQQGDNNLALSSPFRQQQFSERIILQKQPPKVGGDALRAPFEKDYEETMLDLKYVDPNQDDYNEEIKQFLQDIFEASKENSKAYTDHLINHSQLSDYNSDLMDETDRSDHYEFKIDKQSLIWPQPSHQLKFDKERNFFNQECNNYQLEKNIFQQQQEQDHKFPEIDSQLFLNDEVRESHQIIPQQYQSVIQLDEMENENSKQQFGQESTITSMKESIHTLPFKFNNHRNSQEFIPDSQLNIERTTSIQNNLNMNQKTENNPIGEKDYILNKEKNQKDENIEETIKLKISNPEIKKDENSQQNIKVESKCKIIKEGLSPIHHIQEDEYADYDNSEQNTESSNEVVKNNESPCINNQQTNSLSSLMWKNCPLNKQNPKIQILSSKDKINQIFNQKNDNQNLQMLNNETKLDFELNTPLTELGLTIKLSALDGYGVRRANSFCDEENNRGTDIKQKDNEIKKEEKLILEQSYQESIKKSMSDLETTEIDEIENRENDERVQDYKVEIQPIQILSQLKLQSGLSNFDGEQSPIKHDESQHQEQQQQEACTSQVKRSFALSKLNMSLNLKPQSLLEIQKPENFNESFTNGICLSKNNLSILQKPQCDGQQIRSSMSLMERRHQSLRQSINLDTSKNIAKPIQVTNDPKADYLHFLSARPFFWEYYSLQMYCQVLRNLILQLGRGYQGQISRSLTSSPVTNALHLNQLYQQQFQQSNEDDLNRDRTKSNVLPFANPALKNTSVWKERMMISEQKSKQKFQKNRNKKIGSLVFQNISNGLSVVRIFSMRKTFESFSDLYTEVSWPFLFFDSTQINAGDSRFKTEPAIQNFQNKQILQSCLFKSQYLIHMVGSYHFTVPPKYKFFSSNTSNVTVTQVVQHMNIQHDQFPGDFQRAINGLFSLGGQICALWTIAMAQTQPVKPICVRTQNIRSKSSTFSHAYVSFHARNNYLLPTLISTPSIFKTQKQDLSQIQNSSEQLDENKKDEVDPQIKCDYIIQKEEELDSQTKIQSNNILNLIDQNQNDYQKDGDSYSPKSNVNNQLNNIGTEENKNNNDSDYNSIPSNSVNSSPKVYTFQEYYQRQLNDQEEKHLIRICDLLSRNPAQICGLKNKGTIDEGKHADIIIFDPLDTYEFSAFIDEKQKFPAQLHILNSQKVQGRVVATYLRGQKIYEEDKFYTENFIPINEI